MIQKRLQVDEMADFDNDHLEPNVNAPIKKHRGAGRGASVQDMHDDLEDTLR